MATTTKEIGVERTLWTEPYAQLDEEERSLQILGQAILSTFRKYNKVSKEVNLYRRGVDISYIEDKAGSLVGLYKKKDEHGKTIATQLIDFKNKAIKYISGREDKQYVAKALSELDTKYSSVIGGAPEKNLSLY